jgi:hypothetical protein
MKSRCLSDIINNVQKGQSAIFSQHAPYNDHAVS